MSADFYLSTHANYHLHPLSSLLAARHLDRSFATDMELAWIEIWSANLIQKLCRKLFLRQQVSATAVVYFRRFYLRNAYCETDPALVAAACCYVASKAEETPVHIKSAVNEAKQALTEMGIYYSSGYDTNRLAEMEFYLIEELDFHLVIYHPYRALVQLCGRDASPGSEMLHITDDIFQSAWFVINDTYRTSLCLVYPPHLIAVAAIYVAVSMSPPKEIREKLEQNYGYTVDEPAKEQYIKTDPITFLASLNIDHTIVHEIIQQIISFYELWNTLETTATQNSTSATASAATPNSTAAKSQPIANRLAQSAVGTPKLSSNNAANVDEFVSNIISRIITDRQRDILSKTQNAGAANLASNKRQR